MSQATIQMPTHSHKAWGEHDKGCKCQLCLIKFRMADFCYLCLVLPLKHMHRKTGLIWPTNTSKWERTYKQESHYSSPLKFIYFVYVPFTSLFSQLTISNCLSYKHNCWLLSHLVITMQFLSYIIIWIVESQISISWILNWLSDIPETHFSNTDSNTHLSYF